MSKVDVYVADYLTIDEVTQKESELLASNMCVIGMPLKLSYDGETNSFRVSTQNGESLGIVRPKNRLRLQEALENGWPLHCWLSLVYYVNSGDEKLFHGEIVYQFFNVKSLDSDEGRALSAFADKIGHLIASGKRPRVSLTGTEYDQVISSNGSWAPVKTVALPFSSERKSGVVVFKRKRSLSDKVAQAALEKKPGCVVGTAAFFVLLAALIVFVVWRCAFAG